MLSKTAKTEKGILSWSNKCAQANDQYAPWNCRGCVQRPRRSFFYTIWNSSHYSDIISNVTSFTKPSMKWICNLESEDPSGIRMNFHRVLDLSELQCKIKWPYFWWQSPYFHQLYKAIYEAKKFKNHFTGFVNTWNVGVCSYPLSYSPSSLPPTVD